MNHHWLIITRLFTSGTRDSNQAAQSPENLQKTARPQTSGEWQQLEIRLVYTQRRKIMCLFTCRSGSGGFLHRERLLLRHLPEVLQHSRQRWDLLLHRHLPGWAKSEPVNLFVISFPKICRLITLKMLCNKYSKRARVLLFSDLELLHKQEKVWA